MDFYIIGFPKSGTSSLVYYLNQHPDIFIPDFEPHFFSTSNLRCRPFFYLQKTITDYLDIYKHNKHKLCGEKSVFYIYERKAMENILAFNPEAKIIIVRRNRIDFLISMYYQFAYSYGFRGNFTSFINQNADKICQTINDPLNLVFPRQLCISEPQFNELFSCQLAKLALFDNYINICLTIFKRKNVLLVNFLDISKETDRCLSQIFEFIGVKDINKLNTSKKVNGKKQVKNLLLHKTTKHMYMLCHKSKILNHVRYKYRPMRNIINYKWIEKLNSTRINEKIHPSVFNKLNKIFLHSKI